MVTCKNCSNEFEGKFCPECGQKASVRRIVTRDLFTDLLKKLLPWDKGFLFTTRRLLIAPGNMVREYLNGRRVGYTKPLNYLFVVTATVLLVFNQEFFLNGMKSAGQNIPDAQMAQRTLAWIISHMALLMTGLIPFLAICSKLLFRRSAENYAEHLVLNVYLISGCMIINAPVMIFYELMRMTRPSPIIAGLGGSLYLIYFAWGYVQFFRPHKAVYSILKSLLVYALGYALYILFMSVVMGTGFWMYAEFFKSGS